MATTCQTQSFARDNGKDVVNVMNQTAQKVRDQERVFAINLLGRCAVVCQNMHAMEHRLAVNKVIRKDGRFLQCLDDFGYERITDRTYTYIPKTDVDYPDIRIDKAIDVQKLHQDLFNHIWLNHVYFPNLARINRITKTKRAQKEEKELAQIPTIEAELEDIRKRRRELEDTHTRRREAYEHGREAYEAHKRRREAYDGDNVPTKRLKEGDETVQKVGETVSTTNTSCIADIDGPFIEIDPDGEVDVAQWEANLEEYMAAENGDESEYGI